MTIFLGVLVVLDEVNSLASSWPSLLPAFLSGIVSPVTSVVAVYHTDVPLSLKPVQKASNGPSLGEYEPHPLRVLSHLATAIFRLFNLQQEVERQQARNRSLQEPEYGLGEEREGVLVGLPGATRPPTKGRGFVVEMEMRRRSGRAIIEKFVVVPGEGKKMGTGIAIASLGLLADHDDFGLPAGDNTGDDLSEEQPQSTFNLGLTEKQRRDRETVVLPYFDAQIDVGGGEGGRILYEMGREDDFDEEEDEI